MSNDTAAPLPALAPKPWILGIAPYIPGRATSEDGRKVAKLSSNENPFGTPEAAREAYRSAAGELERYPDAAAVELRSALAAHYGIEADRIVYGTGSDEVLHLAAGTFAGPGDEIIHVRYGFAVYEIATRRVGAEPVVVADHDYATKTTRVRSVTANNPTGTYTAKAEIARLHAGLPQSVLLVIDQAYTEYLDAADDDGALELARTQGNVLVTRTFSKIFGLASERIGWGYAAPEIIQAMHRIRAPFAFGIGAQRAAIAALGADDFITRSREHNRQWRSWFGEQIAALGNAGLRVVPSKANFVLVLFEGALTAEVAYKALMDAGYATRWLPGQGLPHGLRITIGTEEEMRAVMDVLRAEVARAG